MSQTLTVLCADNTSLEEYETSPGPSKLEVTSSNGFLFSSLDSALPTAPIEPLLTPHQTSPFLHLSQELRLHIYELAIEAPTGYQRVRADGGRSLYCVDWTTASKTRDDYTYHYPTAHRIQVLMSVCRTTRLDLLETFLRDRVVKFPA
ncbi:hypothetical protein CLAFUW4_06771 [Fulvia fulva]|nr:hypothetical protein CLAFUR4_06779 [Fulvia fulva]WPV15844.1 hypothetical protein CLAFUW4_06771 [Fulvia fulva]WPV30661.1 hypothetical protein CLAFUW7_06770 [Fulvia fulva]